MWETFFNAEPGTRALEWQKFRSNLPTAMSYYKLKSQRDDVESQKKCERKNTKNGSIKYFREANLMSTGAVVDQENCVFYPCAKITQLHRHHHHHHQIKWYFEEYIRPPPTCRQNFCQKSSCGLGVPRPCTPPAPC